MSAEQLREALQEFATRVLGSERPEAEAGADVQVTHPFAWPTTKNHEPVDPSINARATIRVQQRDSADTQVAEKWAAALRKALEADPSLGGHSTSPMRVAPPGDDPREVVVFTRVHDT